MHVTEWRDEIATVLRLERERLLAVAGEMDREALARQANPGWTGADVLAHVLAADADLIWLLTSVAAAGPEVTLDEARDLAEKKSWAGSDLPALLAGLRTQGERVLALVQEASGAALDTRVRVWWRPGPTPLRDVIEDWRDHDAQHAADLRRALARE
jgi:hypothetical protein